MGVIPHHITGLALTITEGRRVVKEGDDISITCSPSSPSVAVVWDIPIAASNDDSNVVEYAEPLRHRVTIRNANINHEGNYTCRVLGDTNGVVSSSTAFVKVLESKPLIVIKKYIVSNVD